MAHFDPYGLADEESNPYAAPRVELRREAERPRGGLAVEPFSMDAVWRMTWSIYKARMGLVIGLVVGTLAVSNGVNLVVTGILEERGVLGLPGTFGPERFLVMVAGVVFGLWLQAGMTVALLKVAYGERASFSDIFRGGRYILSFLWGSIVVAIVAGGAYFLIAFSTILVGALIAQGDPTLTFVLIALGVAVGICIGLFIVVRLYLFQYAIVDRELGGWGAVQLSYRITSGHVLQMIGLALFSSALMLAGFLALIIGLIFTLPLCALMVTCTYVLLVNQAQGVPPKPVVKDYDELPSDDDDLTEL